jgi:glycerol uptake facilitator-like aquaporin
LNEVKLILIKMSDDPQTNEVPNNVEADVAKVVENNEGGNKNTGENKEGGDAVVEGDKNDKEKSMLPELNVPTFSISKFIFAIIFEIFGMFMFITAILLGAGNEATMMAFWVIIVIIYPFSGAHINPALTFADYIYKLELCAGLPKLIFYWVAQLIGGTLALMFAQEIDSNMEITMFRKNEAGGATHIEYPQFLCEFFFTGSFCFIYLYCISPVTKVAENHALNMGIIATWLYYAATSAGKHAVGALNPGVLICFSIHNAHAKPGWWAERKGDVKMILYAHFAGALFFALFFFVAEKMYPDPETVRKSKEDKLEDKTIVEEKPVVEAPVV